MKAPDKIYIDRFMHVPKTHPMVEVLQRTMWAPNPIYTNAMKRGEPIPEGVEKEDALWSEDDTHYLFPRSAGERLLDSKKIVDRCVDAPVKFPKFALKYRPGQQEVVDGVVAYLNNFGSGCIFEAHTGFGKTLCAGAIMMQLGQRTLVLVHTKFLLKQWTERLVSCGIPESKIGWVWQNHLQWGGKYLVTIAMAQTLLARYKRYKKEAPAFFKSFGTVFIDECHRFSSTQFRICVTMFAPKFRCGTSATPRRVDHCEIVFTSHVGPVAVRARKSSLAPKIREVYIRHTLTSKQRLALSRWVWNPKQERRSPREDLVKIVTFLTNHPVRNARLLEILMAASAKDRKVLLLTDRRDHVDVLQKALTVELRRAGSRKQVGTLLGGMKEDVWAVNAQCPIILATTAIAKEALDLPTLDTLILACPQARIIQAVGRILREVPGKKQPIVIDIIDTGLNLCENMARKRFKEYRAKRWTATATPTKLTACK